MGGIILSKKDRKKQSGKPNTNKYTITSILPLILIISIVPLVLRLKILEVPEIVQALNGWDSIIGDFFSYYKTRVFIILVSIGAIIFLYKYFYKKDIDLKKTKAYYPMIIYVIFVILSTIFATYKDVAIAGYVERYEGVYMLICYILVLFLAINLVHNEKQIKYILVALGISSIIMSIMGLTQMVGKDFLASEFGQGLIIPNKYTDVIKNIDFIFVKKIYGTLYNTNYVGVYMSMVFALFATLTILVKDVKFRLLFILVSLLSFINLLGSASRVGLIAIALYFILLIILFRTTIIKSWKITVAIILLLSISVYGFNKYRDDFLKNRILSIKQTITNKQEKSNLEDIRLNNNTATIAIDDYEINIIFSGSGITFLDKDFQFIDTNYNDESGRFSFTEEPYKAHFFQLAAYENGLSLKSNIRTNKGWANFDLVINSDGHFRVLTPAGESTRTEKALSWGFEGREKFASGRGYIWSRSIPLLKDTIVLGHGPDTYALYFPQDDYLGKLQSNFQVMTLVDKPHNMYLQIGINTGLISLLAVLILFGMYILSSIKIYIRKREYNDFIEVAGISIFLSICIYLFTSLSNDSVVSVAPVFWTILGLGININMKIKSNM